MNSCSRLSVLKKIKGVVSKETVVLRRWGSSIQKFGFINRVDNVNWPPYRDDCTVIGDRFHEHLRDVEKNDKDASKPVARHFNLPNHSKKHMAICGLSLHLGTTESRKNLEQKFIFQIGTLNPHGINECFSFIYSFLFTNAFHSFIPIFHVAMLPPIA